MAGKEQNIKTKLSVDGEKAYKDACTSINKSLSLLNSEMKLTTAEYKDNATSIEALKAAQDILQRKYDEQAKKVAEAEKQLEDTIYEYFLGTVHPDNIYSRTNFVKAGYREARQMSKYGGMQRIIMEKEK